MANFNIDYLVVAGGGSGGSTGDNIGSGGGGAGGFITSWPGGSGGAQPSQPTLTKSTQVSYTVTVGDGGIAPTAYYDGAGSGGGRGSNGTASIFDSVSATGGGGGGGGGSANQQIAGGDGGSGGGGASYYTGGEGNNIGSPVQGFDGGTASGITGGNRIAAGGGGASQAGKNGGTSTSGTIGQGGSGMYYASGSASITNLSATYAGGGGGGSGTNGTGAVGNDGGGNGGTWQGASNPPATNGANTGSGGGGGAGYGGLGGNGGSGIVILRYTTADVAGYTTTGLTPTETTVGTDTILSFTTVGTGTITFTSSPPPTPFDGTRATTPVTGFNKTGTSEGLKLPSGDNSNQPAGALAEQGMIRNDTEETVDSSASVIAHYNGTKWQYFAATESVDNPLFASQNFNTVIYTGSTSPHAITGVGFAPDLIWIKNRDQSDSFAIVDSVRGITSPAPYIASDSMALQATSANMPTSVQSDGFTITGNGGRTNTSGEDYVAWCFKAGGLINKSAYFNGSSSIVRSTALGAAFSGQTTLSIAGWFQTSASTSRMTIASFSNTAVGSTDLWIGLYANENTIAFRNSVEGASGLLQVNDTGGSNLRDGNWHHVVFTADSNGTHVYVDGSQLTGYTYSFGNSSTNIQMPSINQFSIGANQDSSASGGQWFMNGIINQVRVFTSALSASQATELYNETVAENSVLNFPNGAGCIAAYPLGENANGVDGLYNGSSSNVTFGKPGYLTRNTEGTIESTVSTNVAAGFSIVNYTGNGSAGATVGHGIDTPELVIVKRLSGIENWAVYSAYSHPTVPQNYLLTLDNTSAAGLNSTRWNNTAPTDAVFSVGTSQAVNASANTYIAYCWHSVPGYSKIGSYQGNGLTTGGPVINFGFEPAFVMIKSTSFDERWAIYDNKRSTSNPRSKVLTANSNATEIDTSYYDINFTDTGFTVNGTAAFTNRSGESYTYLAFANTI
jgi:hypothetical protein